jgi:hypothetical protein
MVRCFRVMMTSVLLLFELTWSAGEAWSQAAKDIVGTWSLVSVTVDRDGNKTEPFGPNPMGVLVFDRSGHFSLVVIRAGLPKLVSNNRMTGSAEENKAIVRGSTAYFGTYSVSEADRMFTVHVEGATFPNWVGTDQKRIFTINGDQLRYTNSSRSGGEGTALVIWKRLN